MRAGLRYWRLVAARTRAPLPALAALILAVLGTYAQTRNPVGETFALTALLGGALSAWLVGAVLAGEPEPQADITTIAVGGRARRLRLEALLATGAGLLVAAAFIVYPLVLVAAGVELFARPVEAADVVAAALGHASCAVLGGTIGLLFGPPRVRRSATSTAATVAALALLAAVPAEAGAARGPLSVADALTDGDAAGRAALTAADAFAALACLVLAAVCLAAAHLWTRATAT